MPTRGVRIGIRRCGALAPVALAILGAAAFAAPARGAFGHEVYAKASNTQAIDSFGSSIAVSGDTMVVGASGEDSNATSANGDATNNAAPGSGAAYVFVRSGQTWVQQAYLKASNTAQNDFFGGSVAIDGDTIVVGAPGEDSDGTSQSDNNASGSGAAYVFTRSGTSWSQQAYLKASNPGSNDSYGLSVAVDANTIVVGAYNEASNATTVDGDQMNESAGGSGAAYVYTRDTAIWSQQAYLKASNSDPSDNFGESVAISGDRIVVGAPGEASNATMVDGDQMNDSAAASGAAYVFTRAVTTWSQQSYLKASNAQTGDLFGDSVAIDGNSIVVGASFEDSNTDGVNGNDGNNSALESGAAFVFFFNGTNWAQQAYLKASNSDEDDSFGENVAISNNTAVVGAVGEDSTATGANGDASNNSLHRAGAAYVFTRSGTTWSHDTYLKASNTGDSDEFGSGVGVSGDRIAVAAVSEESAATGINGDQSNNGALDSGAAYLFSPDTDGDTVAEATDNCPGLANSNQANHDADTNGDLCDSDDDNDTLIDTADNCPSGVTGPGDDPDGDGCKNSEDTDDDGDGVADTADNCQLVANPGQADLDADGIGDACDPTDDRVVNPPIETPSNPPSNPPTNPPSNPPSNPPNDPDDGDTAACDKAEKKLEKAKDKLKKAIESGNKKKIKKAKQDVKEAKDDVKDAC